MRTILHHPGVALSHELVERTIADEPDAEVIDVSSANPDDPRLAAWVAGLPVACRDLLDRRSSLYFALRLDDPKWSEMDVFRAGLDNPSLFRCPIVVAGARAYSGFAALQLPACSGSKDSGGERAANGSCVPENDNLPMNRRLGT